MQIMLLSFNTSLFTEDQREFYTTITIYKSDTGSIESWEEIK